MLHLLQLTRPLNLTIITVTMYGTGWYLEDLFTNGQAYGIKSFNFFLLVISTVIIAAAGNIINDYFDVRADRINKPDKLIIGVHVKRRWAIILHWIFNLTAFSIAAYLSWIFETFWYLFIHLLSINVLWGYSSYFKRKAFIGNMLIAALTGMVPLLVGFYFYHHPMLEAATIDTGVKPFLNAFGKQYIVFIVTAIAFFAFLLNLAREIVKDIEDIEGDKRLKAKTLPIVAGIRNAKLITYFILTAVLSAVVLLVTMFPIRDINSLHPIILATLFSTLAIFMLIMAESKKQLKWVNSIIKIAMIFGTLAPIYWKILLLYEN